MGPLGNRADRPGCGLFFVVTTQMRVALSQKELGQIELRIELWPKQYVR